jgi:hypothetical protein
MSHPLPFLAAPLLIAATVLACGAASPVDVTAEETPSPPAPPVVDAAVPAFYARNFANVVSVRVDGSYVVIVTRNLPDHKSPYYGVGSANYEAYNGSNPNYRANPNRIIEQQLTFRIPIAPTAQATPSPTPLGAIGISVNGLALYNQYAGPNQPLTNEIDSFDQYDGHPQASGQYHYHLEPSWITRTSREALVGVLLDGYPVYGPMEGGRLITSADLDAAHGHTTPTVDFPAGIYHYHTTSEAPYINGTGFVGVPGTVGR